MSIGEPLASMALIKRKIKHNKHAPCIIYEGDTGEEEISLNGLRFLLRQPRLEAVNAIDDELRIWKHICIRNDPSVNRKEREKLRDKLLQSLPQNIIVLDQLICQVEANMNSIDLYVDLERQLEVCISDICLFGCSISPKLTNINTIWMCYGNKYESFLVPLSPPEKPTQGWTVVMQAVIKLHFPVDINIYERNERHVEEPPNKDVVDFSTTALNNLYAKQIRGQSANSKAKTQKTSSQIYGPHKIPSTANPLIRRIVLRAIELLGIDCPNDLFNITAVSSVVEEAKYNDLYRWIGPLDIGTLALPGDMHTENLAHNTQIMNKLLAEMYYKQCEFFEVIENSEVRNVLVAKPVASRLHAPNMHISDNVYRTLFQGIRGANPHTALLRSVIDNVIPISSASADRCDVYLSYCWGYDERRDDIRVKALALYDYLVKKDFVVWFDQYRLTESTLPQEMVEIVQHGVDNSTVFMCLVSAKYVDEIARGDPEDKCHIEFRYAMKRKHTARMVPVVIEDCMLPYINVADGNTASQVSLVDGDVVSVVVDKPELQHGQGGGETYNVGFADMEDVSDGLMRGPVLTVFSGRTYELLTARNKSKVELERQMGVISDYLNRAITPSNRVKQLGSRITYVYSTAEADTTGAESTFHSSNSEIMGAKQVALQSDFNDKIATKLSHPTRNNTRVPTDLINLSVADVAMLLTKAKLSKYIDTFVDNEVTGLALSLCERFTDVMLLGIDNLVRAKEFMLYVNYYKANGVPHDVLM